MMRLATIVSPVAPAITFTVVTVGLGFVIFRYSRRVVSSALVASVVVCAMFVWVRTWLPGDFYYYAEDMIYEPLLRDFLRPASESLLSVAFHFGLPCAILVFTSRWTRRRPAPKA